MNQINLLRQTLKPLLGDQVLLYVQEVLKYLPQIPDPILLQSIFNQCL